ncbi:hypothetical protein [Myxococcus qinghaiensis]|uniref:hypothetical protein n=1 Tax=Myxococcus qinghaiensis TaxID=2906758 RepID=UPI0020A79245|nr:hypothetical protein [Myxococcus qinghaiensis]MCP3169472.1 hypothetical protein [Myxococcus qinghaiensis]
MNRFALLSLCAASLVACTERSSKQSPDAEASPSAPRVEAQAPVVAPPPAAPTPAVVEAVGTPDSGTMAGGTGPSDASTAKCSAMGVPVRPAATGGPPPPPKAVESMRNRIMAAARACDYAELAKLVDEKGKSVRFSFGDGDDAVAYWKEQEAQGEPVLARIVQVLELPYAKQGDIYYWPWLHVTGLKTPQDRKALTGIYSDEELKGMQEAFDDAYVGLRVGISKTGDWQLAVSGD